MKPDYTKLENLDFEAAYNAPALLVEAVEKACPNLDFLDESQACIGAEFGNQVTMKLYDFAEYVMEQPFASFLDFETKLHVISRNRIAADLKQNPFFQKHIASEEAKTEAEVTDEFDADFLAAVEKFQNSKELQNQQYIVSVPSKVKMAIRHALVILNPELEEVLEQRVTAERVSMQKKRRNENLFSKPNYDPDKEKFEEGLSKVFENIDPNDMYYFEYNMQVASNTFLDLSKKMGFFSDGSSNEKIPDNAYPLIRAHFGNEPS